MSDAIIKFFAVIGLLSGIFFIGYWKGSGDERSDNERAALVLAQKNQEASVQAAARNQKETVALKAEIHRLRNSIGSHIPPGLPAIPGGFRLLHDSAATGAPPPPPGTPAEPATLEDIAEIIIENYGACRENMQQLEDLISFIEKASTN